MSYSNNKSKDNTVYQSSNTDYSSSQSSGLYVINNSSKGACKGTCRTIGVCTCN